MENVLGLSDDEFLKKNPEELTATEDSQESTDTVTTEGDMKVIMILATTKRLLKKTLQRKN